MVCDASMCLPPEEVGIEVRVADVQPASDRPDYCAPSEHWCDHTSEGEGHDDEGGMFARLVFRGPNGRGRRGEQRDEQEEGLFWTFLLGFGLGLAALLTPCVFLIPMTVSFFTKQSKTRAEGIRNALITGSSSFSSTPRWGWLSPPSLG